MRLEAKVRAVFLDYLKKSPLVLGTEKGWIILLPNAIRRKHRPLISINSYIYTSVVSHCSEPSAYSMKNEGGLHVLCEPADESQPPIE